MICDDFQMLKELLNDRFSLFQMILEQKLLKEITEDKVCLCVTEQYESNLFSSVCIWINDNIFIYTMELALKKKR